MKIKNLEIKVRSKVNPAKEKIIAHIKSNFFKDTASQLLIIPSVALLLAAWILSFYYFRVSDYLVPLKYNSFSGVLGLGKWY